jgi:hypothetical protein
MDVKSLLAGRRILLMGAVFGLFGGLFLGGALLLLADTEARSLQETPPSGDEALEIIVTEEYIHRMMLESVGEFGGPVTLGEGHLDLRSGSRADFAVTLEAGPLNPIVEGTVGFRASPGGAIEVKLLAANLGRLALGGFIPEGVMDDANEDIERELTDRLGSAGLEVVAVSSDETTLRLYLSPVEDD